MTFRKWQDYGNSKNYQWLLKVRRKNWNTEVFMVVKILGEIL